MTQAADEIIKILISFMSSPIFVQAISELLGQSDPLVCLKPFIFLLLRIRAYTRALPQMRQRALEIFNQKIEEERFIHENQVPIKSLRQLSDIFFAVFPC